MSQNAHRKIFEETVGSLAPESILDAGSGRTSLSLLCALFPRAKIDAVIFPGDERKKKSVGSVGADFELIEVDIAKADFQKTYDLVVLHLLLGEAVKWGNSVPALLEKLFPCAKKHIMVADFPEDPEIDFALIERLAAEHGFKAVKTTTQPSEPPFDGKIFQGNFYRAVLFESAH